MDNYMTPSEDAYKQLLEFEEIELPSNGLLYDNNRSKITVTKIVGIDEGLLTEPGNSEEGFIDTLLRLKIQDKDIDIDDLLLGDRLAILFWLRATSYGVDYPIRAFDPDTNRRFDYNVELDKIPVKKLTIKPDENKEFDYLMPVSKIKIKFKLMTGRDEKEINSKINGYSKPHLAIPIIFDKG